MEQQPLYTKNRTQTDIKAQRKTGTMVRPSRLAGAIDEIRPIVALLSVDVLGGQRAVSKKHKINIVISSLVEAIRQGDDNLIYFTRNRGAYNKYRFDVGHTIFLQVMDDLINMGHLMLVSDPSFSPVDMVARRYEPSQTLLDLMPEEELELKALSDELKYDPFLDINYKPHKLTERGKSKSEQGQYIRYRYPIASEADWEAVDSAIVELRRAMSEHEYTGLILDGRETTLRPLRRLFKGHIEGYGRYHSSYQSMRAETRLNTIRIDGELCCEIDVKASIPSVLFGVYCQRHGFTEKACGDFYQDAVDLLPELSREAVKAMVTVFIGNGKLNKARYPEKIIRDYPTLVKAHSWSHVKAVLLKAIPQLTLLEPHLMDWCSLNYRESECLRRTLEALLAEGIGVLPIHDSIIVPVRHMERAGELFKQSFFYEMGVWPQLSVKFADQT